MNYCGKCGTEIKEGENKCKNCGEFIPQTPLNYQIKKNHWLGIVSLIMAIIGFWTAIFRIGIVLDIIAIIMSSIVLKKTGDKNYSKSLPISSITVAGLSLLLIGIIMFSSFYPSNIKEVEKTIKDIGKISISSIEDIKEAEELYNDLSEEDQKKVDNYDEMFLNHPVI